MSYGSAVSTNAPTVDSTMASPTDSSSIVNPTEMITTYSPTTPAPVSVVLPMDNDTPASSDEDTPALSSSPSEVYI